MPVTLTTDDATKIAELTVDGRVTEDDWQSVMPRFEAFLEQHGTIRLLEIVLSFEGFDPGLIWKGTRFDMKAIPHISHCAFVSDIGWMSPLARAAGAVTPMQVRTFGTDEVAAARDWLRQA
ncbi:hypothetical protein HKCCE3408_03910 [Rhodobacterales bacterium HKCCE3408]|nr:hypothetical protein [Rhodobacterales bacterium HKCCE3408]